MSKCEACQGSEQIKERPQPGDIVSRMIGMTEQLGIVVDPALANILRVRYKHILSDEVCYVGIAGVGLGTSYSCHAEDLTVQHGYLHINC